MTYLIDVLKSRTVWTVIVLFLVAGFQAIDSYIPSGSKVFVEGFLALLAVYFRINPRQQY